MSRESEIIEKLKALGQLGQRVFPATVETVDNDTLTCDASFEGIVLYNVRLKATAVNGDHMVIVPKVGSSILVGILGTGDNAFYMVSASEPEAVKGKIGDTSFVIGSGGIIINNGDLGGMLISQKVIDEISAVKQDLNAIKTVFNSWVTVPNDGGAALKAAAASWSSQQLPAPDPSALINQKVKQ